jgi:acetyl-CoA/propionyl-CoA carboxylase carboxyl transferase subunit
MTILAPVTKSESSTDPRDPLARLENLFDPGTTVPLHARDKSGVLAASGNIDGVRTIAYCSDATVMGGAMGVDGCKHLVKAIDTAIEEESPIVGLWHSGGARLAEGVEALHAVGLVFEAMVRASGLIPQISVVLGFAAGGAAYGPALTDVVIMAPEGRVFVTGPDVVRSVTGEQVDMVSLGGPDNVEGESSFEELQGNYARSIVTGFGRMAGRTVGVIANNPLRLGGCLNSESAEKAARFVRLCNAFGVPLVVVVDVPGYLPGVSMEWEGVVRRGAKLLHAFAEATVPRVTVVTRKIYGGAYIAMNSRALGATAVFAWPNSEVAVMGAKAAVGILHKRALAAAPDDEREALHDRLAAEHEAIAGGVDRAVEIGVVDEEIDPAKTRSIVTAALASAPSVRARHKNIPL